MRSASLYRVCGNSLVLAAVLFTIAAFMAVPAKTTEGLAAATASMSVLGYVLEAIGVVAALAGMIALTRHFQGGAQEGLATLGLAAFAMGAAALFLQNGVGGLSQLTLYHLVSAPGAAPEAFTQAQATLFAIRRGAWAAGAGAAWASLLPFGLAMTRDSAFNRFLGWAGVAVAILELAALFALRGQALLLLVTVLLGFAYLAVLGLSFAGLARRAAAPAGAPAAGGVPA